MLNLNEVLNFKLKLGANPVNVAEILADRLMLAEALDKALIALSYGGVVASNALGEIAQTIDFKKEAK